MATTGNGALVRRMLGTILVKPKLGACVGDTLDGVDVIVDGSNVSIATNGCPVVIFNCRVGLLDDDDFGTGVMIWATYRIGAGVLLGDGAIEG